MIRISISFKIIYVLNSKEGYIDQQGSFGPDGKTCIGFQKELFVYLLPFYEHYVTVTFDNIDTHKVS